MRPLNLTSSPFKARLALALLLVIALAFLCAVPVAAQQVEAGEATVSFGDGKAVAKAGDTVAKAGEGTGATKVQAGNTTVEIETQSDGHGTNTAQAEVVQTETRATPEPSEEEAREEVPQQDTQRATQTAARAADPLAGEPVAIDVNDDVSDPDSVGPISVGGCTVASNATVTVDDGDGTRVRLVNGGNVQIEATSDQITITGPDGGEIETQAIQDGEDSGVFSFGPGTVVSSTGITCGRDDGNKTGGGGGDGENDDNDDGDNDLSDLNCQQILRIFRNDENDQYFSLNGELAQQIQVCLQNEVIVGSDTDDPLPKTGGPPLLALAALGLASAALGASVLRAGLRHGE